MAGGRSQKADCSTDWHQDRVLDASIADSGLHGTAELQTLDHTDELVFPNRDGEVMVGNRTSWLRIAKLGGLPADITPHVLRHSFASLADGLGYNEATIATLIGHKGHSITSRYVHTADAALLAAVDAVADRIIKLMAASPAATPF
jgi:integrase